MMKVLREIFHNQSVRKRRDDSFDATVEIRQPIYTIVKSMQP